MDPNQAPAEFDLKVQGMTCQSCANTVRKYLTNQGLEVIDVDFATDDVRFKGPANLNLVQLGQGIDKLGYRLADVKKQAEGNNRIDMLRNPEMRFWLTLPFSLLLLASMYLSADWLMNPWVQLLLCLPVFFTGIFHFGRSAWQSILLKSPNMDVLIMLGALSAFVYSLVSWWLVPAGHGHHAVLYFETAASIISFVLLGNLIENRAVKAATAGINKLQLKKHKHVKKLIFDLASGKEVMLDAEAADLKPGDRYRVNTGEEIAVDGEVLRGTGLVNEAMLTGESLPATKKPGDAVFGGCLLEEGHLEIHVTKSQKESAFSSIINLMRQARNEKPDIQKLGDRISAVFVPVVVGISLLTFFIQFAFLQIPISEALMRAVAVLVISCPCAMGLATPLAVTLGLKRAMEKGIVVKSGTALEGAAGLKRFILDKTGTLTDGAFVINRFEVMNEMSERDAKNVIHHLETHSNHPLAKAITMRYADWHHHNISFSSIEEKKGKGLVAKDFFGNTFTLGGTSLFETPKNFRRQFDIYLTRNNNILAGFDLSDDLREGAKELVEGLKKRGIEPAILSGDSKKKVSDLAQKLGITEWQAEQSPEQKLRNITKWARESSVGMLGDGMNDAPALARSTVGVSIGDPSNWAAQAAHMVLLKPDPTLLLKGIDLSRRIYSVIKQNLFWALAYNVVAIPLAAAGFLSPELAAFGMLFSDLVVVGNSYRLKLMR